MLFYSWRQGSILSRLGVKPARGAPVSDFVQPVVVLGNVSDLGGGPEPRRYCGQFTSGPVAGQFSVIQLITAVPIWVRCRNFGATAISITRGLRSSPTAGLITPALFNFLYRPPLDTQVPFCIPAVGALAAIPDLSSSFWTLAAGESLPFALRVAPGVSLTFAIAVVNTGVSVSFYIDESVAMEEHA